MSGSTGDFDSLDATDNPLSDAITPELEPLHQRILSDSAAWRSTLPDIALLEQHVATLSARRRERDSRLPRTYSTRDEEPSMPDTQDPVSVDTRVDTRADTRPQLPTSPPRRTGLRNALAAGAVIALVALFAAFFIGLPHAGKTSGLGGGQATTVPSTPISVATVHRAWMPVPALAHTAGAPVISPANPSVVYEDDHAHLRRSDDGGKTWSNLALPSDFPSDASYTWLDLFVSPLDANTVWATAGLSTPDNATSCPFAMPTAFTGGNAMYSGSIPCQAQHVSTDGGKTWKLVKLPFAFMLGATGADWMAGNGYHPYSMPPQAQGSRLYTMTDDGPLAAAATAQRLAMSADGGVTWQEAGAQLTGAGHYICAFAAAPSGSTVFAVTSDSGCGPDNSNSAQALWRSDDAGASWRQATLPANRIVLSLVAAGGAAPTLYAQMPSLSGNSHVGVTAAAVTGIYASTDGGATWHAAPEAGIPAGTATAGPLVTLSDGSVVQAFYVPSAKPSADGKNTFVFARWQAGAAKWSQLGPLALYGIAQLQDIPGAAVGTDTLWLSVPDGNTPGDITYSVQTFAL